MGYRDIPQGTLGCPACPLVFLAPCLLVSATIPAAAYSPLAVPFLSHPGLVLVPDSSCVPLVPTPPDNQGSENSPTWAHWFGKKSELTALGRVFVAVEGWTFLLGPLSSSGFHFFSFLCRPLSCGCVACCARPPALDIASPWSTAKRCFQDRPSPQACCVQHTSEPW